jgi:hypothetical protein
MMNMSRAERAFFLAFAFLIASLITMFNDFMTAALWFGLFSFVSMYVCYDSED